MSRRTTRTVGAATAVAVAVLGAAAWIHSSPTDTVMATSPAPTVASPAAASPAELPPARVPVSPIDDSFPADLNDIVGFSSAQVFSGEVLDVGEQRSVTPDADDPRYVLQYRPVRVIVTRVFAGTLEVGDEVFLRDRSRAKDGNERQGTSGGFDALWPTGQSLTVLSGDPVDVGDGISGLAASWIFVNLSDGRSVEIVQSRSVGLGDTPVPTARLEGMLHSHADVSLDNSGAQ